MKLWYYIWYNNFYYITHIVSYYYKWLAIAPGTILTLAGIASAYDLYDVPFSTDELSIFVNENKFGTFTLSAVMWIINAFVADIPGVDNSSEAAYYNYWPAMFTLPSFGADFTTWNWIASWMTTIGSIMKWYYKYDSYGELPFTFDEVDLAEVMGWNALMAILAGSGIDYALGITLLQAPWYAALWLYFDGDADFSKVPFAM